MIFGREYPNLMCIQVLCKSNLVTTTNKNCSQLLIFLWKIFISEKEKSWFLEATDIDSNDLTTKTVSETFF